MERLTDHQIETLADHWPWEYEESAAALRLAEEEGWPLDDTVRALDRIADEFGVCANPIRVIKAAINHKRSLALQRPRVDGPS